MNLPVRLPLMDSAITWMIIPLLVFTVTGSQAATVSSGNSNGTFSVSPYGTAKYHRPLPVPPGIDNHQTHLALTYDSSGRNGKLGVSWRISGLSSITRCSAIPAIDGTRGTVSYGPSDRFCVDGQRLILVKGTYGAPGSEYHTELETWRLFVASDEACGQGPCRFSVSLPDGGTARYGASSDSRIPALNQERKPRPDVRVWAMTDHTDKNGNSITFKYSLTPDGTKAKKTDGQYYPVGIRYGPIRVSR